MRPEDAGEWQRLRLIALEAHPTAFLTTLEEAKSRSLESVADFLGKAVVFGAFEADTLVGKMTLAPMSGAAGHRANIFAVYVDAKARRRNVASDLLAAAVERARVMGVSQLELHVECENTPAVKFYRKQGFEVAGTIPRAMRVGDDYHDDHIMVLSLDA